MDRPCVFVCVSVTQPLGSEIMFSFIVYLQFLSKYCTIDDVLSDTLCFYQLIKNLFPLPQVRSCGFPHWSQGGRGHTL